MKIFYITSVLGDSGGSEIYTRDLLKELMNRGHELCIFTTSHYKLKGAKTIRCPTAFHHAFHKFEAPLFYWKALKAAADFKPDLVQSHSNSCMGLIGHLVKRKMKIPHVLLIELISSRNFTLHSKAVFQMEKFMLPKLNYDKLVVWTRSMKENFLIPWGIGGSKIKVIPAAVELSNYAVGEDGGELKEKHGQHLITSIKTLWKSNAEGLKYIIKAMKYVKEKHPEYKYLIFGNGKQKAELEELTAKLSLDDVVKFMGEIKPQKCREVWQATEVAPHSFVYEFSTSISLLEYMASGKACVVTDIGAVRGLVGNSALVVRAMNEKAIADGIIKLIENPSMRKELEKKARSSVEKNYSMKKAVDELEGVYAEVLG